MRLPCPAHFRVSRERIGKASCVRNACAVLVLVGAACDIVWWRLTVYATRVSSSSHLVGLSVSIFGRQTKYAIRRPCQPLFCGSFSECCLGRQSAHGAGYSDRMGNCVLCFLHRSSRDCVLLAHTVQAENNGFCCLLTQIRLGSVYRIV